MILRALPSAARPLFCLSRITQLYSCCIGECVCGGGGRGGCYSPCVVPALCPASCSSTAAQGSCLRWTCYCLPVYLPQLDTVTCYSLSVCLLQPLCARELQMPEVGLLLPACQSTCHSLIQPDTVTCYSLPVCLLQPATACLPVRRGAADAWGGGWDRGGHTQPARRTQGTGG